MSYFHGAEYTDCCCMICDAVYPVESYQRFGENCYHNILETLKEEAAGSLETLKSSIYTAPHPR
jgi:hypothetical protein